MQDLLTMFFLLFAVVGGTYLLFFVLTSPHRAQDRRRVEKADALLKQAESKMLTGDLDAAFSLFLEVLPLVDGVEPFLFSEAYYGLARVSEKKGDLKYAAQCINFALAYVEEWRHEKPNFEKLLRNEQRRVLDEIGKLGTP